MAYTIVSASESGNLIFTPQEDTKRIWEGIMYLYGIDMMENPTEIENKIFAKIEIERSEYDWLVCFIRDSKFEGRCGTRNLPEVFKIFRDWATSK